MSSEKKIGIMQPYFYPYLGYWQLINAVDTFILLDDVNYIKQGFINRNSICINGQPGYITLPLKDASSNKDIFEISTQDNGIWKKKLLKKIKQNYSKAPYFNDTFPFIEDSINFDNLNLSSYLYNSIKVICQYLDITTNIIESSRIYSKASLFGQERVINICKQENATSYINSIGGQVLYDKENFLKQNIQLSFLKTNHIHYRQHNKLFIPNLSIIDIIMWNSKYTVTSLLDEYNLE